MTEQVVEYKNLALLRQEGAMIQDNWELIKYAVSASVPKDLLSDALFEGLYFRLAKGGMWCFFLVGEVEDRPVALGMFLLEPQFSDLLPSPTLNIWGVYAYRNLPAEVYPEILGLLVKVGSEMGFRKLVGVMDGESLIGRAFLKAVEAMGFSSGKRLVEFNLMKEV